MRARSSAVFSHLLLSSCLAVVPTAALSATDDHGLTLGTAFTYQGRLQQHGAPADGVFDLGFELWDSRDAGSYLGRVDLFDVPVRQGAFLVELDFGYDVFADQIPWLEIQVRPAASGAYVALEPRQRLASAGGGCTVDSDVQINGTLDIDAPGTVPELRIACCNGVDDGGQILLNGFLGGLAISDSEIETTAAGSPSALRINADGGNVGIGVASPQAPLHLPSGPDANPTSGGALVIGSTTGASIAFDSNEILARNNGSVATLTLNNEGGTVRIGGQLDIGVVQATNVADSGLVTATCPAGTFIMSGGCFGGLIENSYPIDSTRWRCEFDDSSNNKTYAICGRLQW